MNVHVEWSTAAPILISSSTSVALLGFDRALRHQTRLYYDNTFPIRAHPHMVRNFTSWWMDLTALIGAGLSALATTALLDEQGQRIAVGALGTTYFLSALLAALRYQPFEYYARFRLLRAVIRRIAAKVSPGRAVMTHEPRTSPAFTLIMIGNLVGLSYAVSV